MHTDLKTHPKNTHAAAANDLLTEAKKANTPLAAALAAQAQAHATLALAQETAAAAYSAETAALINYYATLTAGTHADTQHAAVIDKLIRERLNLTPTTESTP